MTSDTVRHNESDRQFELPVEGGLAFVSYSLRDREITFHHTEVPPQSEGKGIAAKIVAAALGYARDHELRVVPECAYVSGYLKRHGDQYADLDIDDGD